LQLVDTFKASLDPSVFKLYRRYLYSRYKATDELAQPEVVHEKAKERLLKMAEKFRQNAHYFEPGEQLAVNVKGHRLAGPVGVAAGFDKNCDVLEPMSYVFGFLNPGSVLKDARAGNSQRPKSQTVRIAVDDEREAIVNAQGYPHKGLGYAVRKLEKFRQGPKGNARILLNFSGITESYTEDAVLDSCDEIIRKTLPYVDFGFEENRTSPNTDFNKVLQTPAFTKKIIDLMNSLVPRDMIKASKISPYNGLVPLDEERQSKLESIRIFCENGGDAVVIGNTRPVDRSSVVGAKKFSRGIAGESGRPLFPYMLKLVEDVHKAFPDLPIIACGGIFSGEDAWKAYEKGATLVSLYTALTFYGFGVVREIHEVLKKKLGDQTLQDFLDKRDGHHH
jgi:dihydroorotate dehydrogenase